MRKCPQSAKLCTWGPGEGDNDSLRELPKLRTGPQLLNISSSWGQLCPSLTPFLALCSLVTLNGSELPECILTFHTMPLHMLFPLSETLFPASPGLFSLSFKTHPLFQEVFHEPQALRYLVFIL